MSDAATIEALLTTEELLALPDDGRERWIIEGQLRENPMTTRNRVHCRAVTRIGKFLDNWLDGRPVPRGEVLSGEAGVRLKRNPDTTVGVDVAYVSAELLAQQSGRSTIIEGAPTLVVEVLSPNDTQQDIHEKTAAYLNGGVSLVWIAEPVHKVIGVYRRGQPPEFFTADQEITAEPELPGFRVRVGSFFE